MIAWCTYCSSDKRTDPGRIPAIDRYLDVRIQDLATQAEEAGAAFLILSGEYGLLRPEDPIPWYDHLLRTEEVDALVERVAAQMKDLSVTSIVWHTVDSAHDPQVLPYQETIARASHRVGVSLKTATLPLS